MKISTQYTEFNYSFFDFHYPFTHLRIGLSLFNPDFCGSKFVLFLFAIIESVFIFATLLHLKHCCMKAKDILLSHQLKRTSCREGIIELMIQSGQALSENEIRDRLASHYDRTTFYRSFKTLVQHQILHKIVIDTSLVKYGLDQSRIHQQLHPHFYCNDCHSVSCLEELAADYIRLPNGFVSQETEILIKGLCPECKNQHSSR